MADELPPLGKYFCMGYDSDDREFPIVAVHKDSRPSKGYEPPVMMSACPSEDFPLHVLASTKMLQEDYRAVWIYQQYPGPIIPAPNEYDAAIGSIKSHSQVIRATLKVIAATVSAGGTGGSSGTQTVTGTTGTGTKFQASVTVSGGAITAVLSITVAGIYTNRPPDLSDEPVTGASLVGAKLSIDMDAIEAASLTLAGSNVTRITYQKVNEFSLNRITENYTLPGPLLSGVQVDETSGVVVNYTKQVVAAGTAGGITTVDGITYYAEIVPVDAAHSIKITSWIIAADLPDDLEYQISVDIQIAADSFSNTGLNATSGFKEAHGVLTVKTAGARGPKMCNVVEKWVDAAGLAALTFGTMRTITSGSTSAVYSGELAVTGMPSTDFSGYCDTFAITAPANDGISGSVLSVRVDALRFGVFNVKIISVP